MKKITTYLTTLCLVLLLASQAEAQKRMQIPRACAVDDTEMGTLLSEVFDLRTTILRTLSAIL